MIGLKRMLSLCDERLSVVVMSVESVEPLKTTNTIINVVPRPLHVGQRSFWDSHAEGAGVKEILTN